jgi:hypothetical protein
MSCRSLLLLSEEQGIREYREPARSYAEAELQERPNDSDSLLRGAKSVGCILL